MAAHYPYVIGDNTYYFNQPIEYDIGDGSTAIPPSNLQSYAYATSSTNVDQGIVTWSPVVRLIQVINLVYPNYTAYYSFNSRTHIQIDTYDVNTPDLNFLGTGQGADILVNTRNNKYLAVLTKVDVSDTPVTDELLDSKLELKDVLGWPGGILYISGPYELSSSVIDASSDDALNAAKDKLLKYVRDNMILNSRKKPETWDELFNMTELIIIAKQVDRYPESSFSVSMKKTRDPYIYPQYISTSRNDRPFLGELRHTELPPEIGLLTNLQILNISLNQLTYLPATIGNLRQLQILNLSHNKLTSLPATIGNLGQLQTLDLSYNELTSLPEEIGHLIKLRELYINGNELTSLPATIGDLAQLQVLNLYRNKLTSLPASMVHLTQLQVLDLNANKQLQDLPHELKYFKPINEKLRQKLISDIGLHTKGARRS